jgi:hypothetical protein
VRFTAGLTTLADYFPRDERDTFELPEQRLPEQLERGTGETLATWRDRLYQQFRVPTMLAGLTDVKTAYVEVGNPLLARSVLECVRALPDALRTEKRLWRELVGAQLPEVALATRVAIPSLAEVLADPRVQEILLAELTSARSAAVLSPQLRARCCAALRAAGRALGSARRESRSRPVLLRAVPERLRAAVRTWRVGHASLEPLVLAFRAFVAVRMHAQLGVDAATRPARLEPAVNV